MGCAANNETISGTHNGYGESEDRAVQRLTLTDINVDNEYADGYAWMRLSTEEYSSMDGMVNKDGKVIAAIPTTDYVDKEYEGHSEFEEGYAFLFFDTEIHVLDTNGDIISTQKIGEDYRLAACGAGYMVIENHIHDFDHNSYEYVIYNPQGEEITRYIPSDVGKTAGISMKIAGRCIRSACSERSLRVVRTQGSAMTGMPILRSTSTASHSLPILKTVHSS